MPFAWKICLLQENFPLASSRGFMALGCSRRENPSLVSMVSSYSQFKERRKENKLCDSLPLKEPEPTVFSSLFHVSACGTDCLAELCFVISSHF